MRKHNPSRSVQSRIRAAKVRRKHENPYLHSRYMELMYDYLKLLKCKNNQLEKENRAQFSKRDEKTQEENRQLLRRLLDEVSTSQPSDMQDTVVNADSRW